MNTKSFKSWGRLFGAFLVMTFTSATVLAAPDTKPDPAQAKARREARQATKVEKLAKELNLTPAQKDQVKTILQQEREQRKAVVHDTMTAAKPKLDALQQQTSTKLKGVLNAQQYAQYETRRKERQERRQLLKSKRQENNA
jgi:Spy/CpxP family protein refolding chaperone